MRLESEMESGTSHHRWEIRGYAYQMLLMIIVQDFPEKNARVCIAAEINWQKKYKIYVIFWGNQVSNR